MTLFTVGVVDARALGVADVPAVQAFFEANPAYALATTGQPPAPDEAATDFAALPPSDMQFTQRWVIGFERDGRLIAYGGVLSDFLAPRVWHIGLFIVATTLQGTGTARSLYEALERWMAHGGAQWIRLGVVEGNTRAERFWARLGYEELRKRSGVPMGPRVNTVRVLFKPLAGGTRAQYLARVARDDPDASLS